MATSAGRERRFRYALHNDSLATAEVVVALPTDGPDQVVRSVDVRVLPGQGVAPPQERLTLPDGAAVMITLPPDAKLKVSARVRPWTRCLDDDTNGIDADDDTGAGAAQAAALTPDQRRHCLRATPTTPLTPELGAEASAIVGASADPVSRARCLFDHLTGGLFRRTDSADSHGAAALRESREGDAADFAWLFVAWCRSLGIPARTVHGAWPTVLEERHTWAEFHVDGLGWVPVDPGVAVTLRGGDDSLEAFDVGSEADAHFGGLVGERVVFVRDGPVELPARFHHHSDDLDVAAVPQPDLVVMHDSDAASAEASWDIWFSGWRALLNVAHRVGLVALVGMVLYLAVSRFVGLGVPGFLLPLFIGLGIATVVAGLILRRPLSIEASVGAAILGGLAIQLADMLRDTPVIGPILEFLFF